MPHYITPRQAADFSRFVVANRLLPVYARIAEACLQPILDAHEPICVDTFGETRERIDLDRDLLNAGQIIQSFLLACNKTAADWREAQLSATERRIDYAEDGISEHYHDEGIVDSEIAAPEPMFGLEGGMETLDVAFFGHAMYEILKIFPALRKDVGGKDIVPLINASLGQLGLPALPLEEPGLLGVAVSKVSPPETFERARAYRMARREPRPATSHQPAEIVRPPCMHRTP